MNPCILELDLRWRTRINIRFRDRQQELVRVTFIPPYWISIVSPSLSLTNTHMLSHTLEGMLCLPICDLTKMLITEGQTPFISFWIIHFTIMISGVPSGGYRTLSSVDSTLFLQTFISTTFPSQPFQNLSNISLFPLSYPSSLSRSWSLLFN